MKRACWRYSARGFREESKNAELMLPVEMQETANAGNLTKHKVLDELSGSGNNWREWTGKGLGRDVSSASVVTRVPPAFCVLLTAVSG